MPSTISRSMIWPALLDVTRQREALGGAASAAPSTDRRTEFDRDYDRSLFAAATRRLQDKAQVFPLERNDSVRTRLTHSLEVSTIARQLAGNVAQWLLDEGRIDSPQAAQAIEAIAATAGLLHDLGNPPFGHSGEAAIRSWFVRRADDLHDPATGESFASLPAQHRQDFLRFEGNAQTLRLVSKLQVLADFHGLNLTVGTLSALAKYVARSDEADPGAADHARSKPGHFASENDLVACVRDRAGTGAARHPVTYLVEAADDIVYSIIDLEDGVKKGVLDWTTLVDELRAQSDGAAALEECIGRAVRRVETSPMTLAGRARDEAHAAALRTAVISRTVDAAARTFIERYDAIMAGMYADELVQDGAAAPIVRACKMTGRRHVYGAADVTRLEIMGHKVLHDLMDLFWEAASTFEPSWLDARGHVRASTHAAKVYAMLSTNYRTVFEHALEAGAMPPLYCRLQLVTDHIAGMTDSYACTLHRQVTNAM
jgi:dGTPase